MNEAEHSAPRAGGRRLDRAIVAIEALVGIGVVVAIVGKTYGLESTVSFVAVGLAAAAAGYFLVIMFGALRDETLDVPGRVFDRERERLEHEKQLLLAGIKEFEADAAQGKVDPTDYAVLRQTAEARAVEIIRALKESDAKWMREAEALVASKLGKEALVRKEAVAAPVAAPASAATTSSPSKAAATQPGTPVAIPQVFDDRPTVFKLIGNELQCTACDGFNPSEARFCVSCGRPRSEGVA